MTRHQIEELRCTAFIGRHSSTWWGIIIGTKRISLDTIEPQGIVGVDLGVSSCGLSGKLKLADPSSTIGRSECSFARVLPRTDILDVIGQLRLSVHVHARRSARALEIKVLPSRPLNGGLDAGIVIARHLAVVVLAAFQDVLSAVVLSTLNVARPGVAAFTFLVASFTDHLLKHHGLRGRPRSGIYRHRHWFGSGRSGLGHGFGSGFGSGCHYRFRSGFPGEGISDEMLSWYTIIGVHRNRQDRNHRNRFIQKPISF